MSFALPMALKAYFSCASCTDSCIMLCFQYEGVSRMQTSLRRRHRDRVVRRGANRVLKPPPPTPSTFGRF